MVSRQWIKYKQNVYYYDKRKKGNTEHKKCADASGERVFAILLLQCRVAHIHYKKHAIETQPKHQNNMNTLLLWPKSLYIKIQQTSRLTFDIV